MGVRTTRLPGLDGIRAIAAICIILGHIPQKDFGSWSVQSLPVPDLCAYTFLVLSGFLAGYKSRGIGSYGVYLCNKAKRLLPPYFLCISSVLLIYAFSSGPNTVINCRLLYYLFLVPQIPFSQANGITPLVHLWFIGVLVLFHLIFPLVCKKDCIVRSLVVIVVWLALKFSIYFLIGKDCFLYRFVSCTALDCLFLGVIIGHLFFKESHVIHTICDNKGCQLITWVLFIAFGFYKQFIPAPIRIQFFAILSVLMILSQLSKHVLINLDNSVLSFLGKISYETYLFHVPVIIGLSSLYLRMSIPNNSILIYIACITTSLIVAFLANCLFGLKYGYSYRIRSCR